MPLPAHRHRGKVSPRLAECECTSMVRLEWRSLQPRKEMQGEIEQRANRESFQEREQRELICHFP